MVLERQRLQVGVELRAQLEQRLQPHAHEDHVRDQVQQPGQELQHHDHEAQDDDHPARGHLAEPAGQGLARGFALVVEQVHDPRRRATA